MSVGAVLFYDALFIYTIYQNDANVLCSDIRIAVQMRVMDITVDIFKEEKYVVMEFAGTTLSIFFYVSCTLQADCAQLAVLAAACSDWHHWNANKGAISLLLHMHANGSVIALRLPPRNLTIVTIMSLHACMPAWV